MKSKPANWQSKAEPNQSSGRKSRPARCAIRAAISFRAANTILISSHDFEAYGLGLQPSLLSTRSQVTQGQHLLKSRLQLHHQRLLTTERKAMLFTSIDGAPGRQLHPAGRPRTGGPRACPDRHLGPPQHAATRKAAASEAARK